MGLWTERVVPRLVDYSLKGHEVGELRDEVCADLGGRVLEIGFGSGLNTRSYPTEVAEVGAVEPSDLAWEMSGRRRDRVSTPVVRVGLDGQHLAVDDSSYDHVLSTFTLCTILDVHLALAEVRRVLRPGGSLHFLEHGLAPTEGVQRWQRRLEPVQRRLAGGCHLTRDIPALVSAAGLEVTLQRAEYLPGPGTSKAWIYCSLGRGVRSG